MAKSKKLRMPTPVEAALLIALGIVGFGGLTIFSKAMSIGAGETVWTMLAGINTWLAVLAILIVAVELKYIRENLRSK